MQSAVQLQLLRELSTVGQQSGLLRDRYNTCIMSDVTVILHVCCIRYITSYITYTHTHTHTDTHTLIHTHTYTHTHTLIHTHTTGCARLIYNRPD